MSLLDAFKSGGIPGAAFTFGSAAANNPAQPLFSSSNSNPERSIFGLGLSEKIMITLVLGTVFVVATSRALK